MSSLGLTIDPLGPSRTVLSKSGYILYKDGLKQWCKHGPWPLNNIRGWLTTQKDPRSPILCPTCTDSLIVVRVEDKREGEHPWTGQGSRRGYTINGRQGAPLRIAPGNEYMFDIDTPGHPFYMTSDDTGGLGAEGGGEKTYGFEPTEKGIISFMTSSSLGWPDRLFYQCRIHPKMGGEVHVLYDNTERGGSKEEGVGSASTSLLPMKIRGGFESLTCAAWWRGELYVSEQKGAVYNLGSQPQETDKKTLFLDIRPFIASVGLRGSYDERGLLGMAFHPRLPRLYVYYTVKERQSTAAWETYNCLSEFQFKPGDKEADLKSEDFLLKLPQRRDIHNAGTLLFEPGTEMLFLATGDDDLQGGPNATSQKTAGLYGKILRLDVNPGRRPQRARERYAIPEDNPFADRLVWPQWAPEVWALGLRNPWALSWLGGRLLIGDTGWTTEEELNVGIPGANYGWPYMEGRKEHVSRPQSLSLVPPIYSYPSGVIVGVAPMLQVSPSAVLLADFYGTVRVVDVDTGEVIISPLPLVPGRGVFIKAVHYDHASGLCLILASERQGPQGTTSHILSLVKL